MAVREKGNISFQACSSTVYRQWQQVRKLSIWQYFLSPDFLGRKYVFIRMHQLQVTKVMLINCPFPPLHGFFVPVAKTAYLFHRLI